MTNREKLTALSTRIKNLNIQLLGLDELISNDGFGDLNEINTYQNMPVEIHKATLEYHSFVVKIVHDKLELDDEC